ncbi:DUF7828 domain-containing protein [Lelliottia amnigena]|uniref:DUF7828 domain-containing protein n=1 Tax=Lelliottia amnigena TaxID=61646 RepID=UPI00345E4E91
MLFNKIRAARQADGRLVSVRDLTVSSSGAWNCVSCGNPLLLSRTHGKGLYFEHDEEQVDDNNLMVCGYSSASNFAENCCGYWYEPQPLLLLAPGPSGHRQPIYVSSTCHVVPARQRVDAVDLWG